MSDSIAEAAACVANGAPPELRCSNPPESSIRDAIGIAVEKVIASGLVEKTLEESIGKCVESALKSMTGQYSEFGKALQQQLAAALNCGTDLGLPSYGHTLLQIVQRQVNETLNGHLYANIQKTLADLLETPPATIKLTELVQRFIEDNKDSSSRDGSDQITLRVDHSDVVDGFRSISLDPRSGRGQYQCVIRLNTDREGQVYNLQIDGAKIEEKLFVGNLRHFEKFLFQLFVCKVPIEFDADPSDIDTEYPTAKSSQQGRSDVRVFPAARYPRIACRATDQRTRQPGRVAADRAGLREDAGDPGRGPH